MYCKNKKKYDREEFEKQFIRCEDCGYRNYIKYVQISGICNCCHKVLDEKAIFKNKMKNKLKIK